MPRIALFNMTFGFFVITVAACAGAFIATDLTEVFVQNHDTVNSWELILERSAHGHTNLFGMLHILFGLTIPYSHLTIKVKKMQTFGLVCGTLAMSIGMYFKAHTAPSLDVDIWSALIGTSLSLALVSLGAHCAGLWMKFAR
jgi:hypothetical protein